MLMRGIYGELQPKARISKPFDKWLISSGFIRNLPEIATDGSEAAAVEVMEGLGFTCTRIHDFRGDFYECIHRETVEALEAEMAEKAREDARWEANAENGFVRFGKCPKSGHSRNYRDGFDEAGVSCYSALFLDGQYRLILTEAQKAQMYTYAAGRDVYRLCGEVVGVGSDGEPLLRVSRKKIIEKRDK